MTIPAETENVATQVVDAAFSVHSNLGPGLLESVYEECLAFEFSERELKYDRQLVVPIRYREHEIDSGLRLDFLIQDCVVVEVKAVECLVPVHTAQLLTYLKLSGHRLGFLINFNSTLIKNGIHRYIM
jgi:GxxExxY protein